MFFNKNLKIDYANEKSDRVAKRDGTFVPKDRRKKRELEESLGGINTRIGAGANNSGVGVGVGAADYGSGHAKRMKLEDANSGPPGAAAAAAAGVNVHDPSTLLNEDNTNTAISSSSSSTTNHNHINNMEDSPPSNILFADSLPKDCNEMMLACLFRNYPGYKESRIPRQGLAFIEFDDEPHATVALKALNGFNLSATEALNLKYGKA